MQNALSILNKYWGYTSFRPIQDQIIQSVLDGKDTLGLLPTGGGKSLCFQVPAMASKGICIVISPLVALMKDQVQQLQKRNIKAIALTGGIHTEELIELLDNCQYGNYKFLYLSPERLEQDWVLERIKDLEVSLVAIDEAHCISQWGHDFRPSYLKIAQLKKNFPSIPFIALTASATPEVQKDILDIIGLEKPAIFTKSFARENLAYHVIKAEDKLYKVQQILTKNPAPSIIYVRNRKACLQYATQLNAIGFNATYYHGGLSIKEKETNMNAWLTEKQPIIIATSAFGMGIDKPNVKTVIHINLPENLESYYQEAGRAGRNEEKAFAILITSLNDVEQAQNQFLAALPEVPFLKVVYKKICSFFQIPYGEGLNEVFSFSLNTFCAHYNLPVLKTFNALQFLDRQGIISLTNEQSNKTQLQFILESKEVLRYISLNPQEAEVITTILRNYPGIFEIKTNLNTVMIAKKAGVSEKEVIDILQKLAQKGLIEMMTTHNESKITFLEVREDDRTINRVSKYLEKQNRTKKSQLEAVITYINDEKQCKSRLLLTYFGEKVTKNCGVCSYCISLLKNTEKQLHDQFLETLSTQAMTSRDLEKHFAITETQVLKTLKTLIEYNKIALNNKNQFILKQ